MISYKYLKNTQDRRIGDIAVFEKGDLRARDLLKRGFICELKVKPPEESKALKDAIKAEGKK